MEVKNVESNAKRNYPKINEIGKKKVKDCMFNRWTKLGLSTTIITMLFQNRSFGDLGIVDGMFPITVEEVPQYQYNVGPVVEVIAIIVFLIAGINILKIKKKEKETEKAGKNSNKVKLYFKILFIISVIIIIANLIVWGYLNWDYFKYLIENT